MSVKVLLVLTVLAAVLVGCQGEDTGGAGKDPTKQIDATAKPTLPRPGMVGSGGGGGSSAAPTAEPQ